MSSGCPSISALVYPKMCSAAGFTERMTLAASIVMIASGAVSASTR
jgi:hypothetical protein